MKRIKEAWKWLRALERCPECGSPAEPVEVNVWHDTYGDCDVEGISCLDWTWRGFAYRVLGALRLSRYRVFCNETLTWDESVGRYV